MIKFSISVLALALGISGPAEAAPQPRPNIVVMLADDWGFSDVGAFGGEIQTPNLDELARRGMRFSNFHVSASCSPTRSMLLTGVDNHRNGVGNMRETIPQSHMGKPGYLSVLNTNVVTVATRLRDGGYRTYAAGKWHVGKEVHNLPPARGFDRSIVMGDSGSDNWETGKRYLDLTDKVYWFEDGHEVVMPADFYSSKFYVDKAIDYIKSGKASGKPFFAYLAFQANHIPLQAPPEFIAKYKGRYKDGWAVLRQERRDKAIALGLVPKDMPMQAMSTTTDWNKLSASEQAYEARRMEVYAGMAEAMDFHVGRLLAHLKQTGEYDNTVFVFLSDNGAEASDPYATTLGAWWLDREYNRDIDRLGGKGAYSVLGPSWGSAVAAPLATYKFYAGEGGIRVPLIISGLPGMAQNQIHASLAHVNDITPTLLDLAQIERPGASYQGRAVEPLVGVSLLPVLQGKAQWIHAPDEAIGLELSGNQALFKGNLKLLKNITPVGDGQWHLYDLSVDPGETNDLQAILPEAFKAMQEDYAAYAKANGVLPMPEGYSPIQQVFINSFLNVYVPRYRLQAGLLVAGLLVLTLVLRRRRKK
jgi:arylsulfatase/uncharacterized sulfatase